MRTLKLKLLENNVLRRKEKNVLVEAINKELLDRYNVQISKLEKLENYLGQLNLDELREETNIIVIALRSELKKAINFKGKESGIPGKGGVINYFRSILGKYYKGGQIKIANKFINQFNDTVQNIVNNLKAILPSLESKKQLDEPLEELMRKISSTIDLDDIVETVVNSSTFNESNWNSALRNDADKVKNISINQLLSLVKQLESINELTGDIMSDINATEESGSANNISQTQSTESDSSEDLITKLAKMDPDKVDSLVRAVNRKRRKLSRG
jgi:hypothetical protein